MEVEGFATRDKTCFSSEVASSYYNRTRAGGSKAFLFILHFNLHVRPHCRPSVFLCVCLSVCVCARVRELGGPGCLTELA